MSAAVPASLAKRGLMRVTDNLQPGDEIKWNFHMFSVFRPELEARFISPAPKREKDACDEQNKLG